MALDQARAASCPFPLAILDFQMPDMDGFTLAARIRAQAELRDTRLFMLTSAGQRGDAARCQDIGIAAYLLKPVKQSALLDAIAHSLGRPAAARVVAADPPLAKRVAPQAARSAGRGQRDQSETGGPPAREARALGDSGQRWRRGGGGGEGRRVRRGSDGRADAEHERPGSRGGHPDSGARHRQARAHRRHDGARHEGRSGALPGGGNGRLHFETDSNPTT